MAAQRTQRPRAATKRDPERTRSTILHAATRLFTRCGLDGVSLDDISKEAGVNRGLIYHYFKTKESLFDQALARPLARYAQQQLELLQQRQFDADALREAVSEFFRFLGRQPELVRLLSWTLAMRRMALELPQLELTRVFFQAAVNRLDQAKASGVIREDIDAAHLLISAIDLCVAWHLTRAEWVEKFGWSQRDPASLDEQRLAAILDLLEAAVTPRGERNPTGGTRP
jgi:TetR/AcrR family transcriptional regulator